MVWQGLEADENVEAGLHCMPGADSVVDWGSPSVEVEESLVVSLVVNLEVGPTTAASLRSY